VRIKARPHDHWNLGLILSESSWSEKKFEVLMTNHVYRFESQNLEVVSESR
jgi:hypothetical protein